MPSPCGSLAGTIRAAAIAAAALAALPAAAEGPKIVGARLGVGHQHKLGFWAPLEVLVEGGDAPAAVTVLAITPDNDGVAATTTAPGGRPLSTEPGKTSEQTLYIRLGQQYSPIEARLFVDGGRADRRLFLAEFDADPEEIAAGAAVNAALSATTRLVIRIGSPVGLAEAIGFSLERAPGEELVQAPITDAARLPRDAIGYDAVDTVLLAPGRAGAGELIGLTASDPRVAALREWVTSGGRLVLACGAAADDLIGPGGPLAEFAPGSPAGSEALRLASPLESYVEDLGDFPAIDLDRADLNCVALEGVEGRVELAAASQDTLPLIVRRSLGFGEVVFVAFDLDAAPIAGWQGRKALIARLLRLPTEETSDEYDRYGDEDLVTRLIGQLDQDFVGVATPPFLLIVGLVIGYLGLIGPGDWWFVNKVLKRPEATWITFPLIVVATSTCAYFAANWLKGSQLRLNQVELIDVDCRNGAARGAVVSHLFSPKADRYNLRLEPRQPSGETIEPEAMSLAWLGKPGYGLDGMQRGGGAFGRTGLRPDYAMSATPLLDPPGLDPLLGVPVPVWSTKTFTARWRGAAEPMQTRLVRSEGLLEGSLTNTTGARLTDCRLLYGDWAWRIGALVDGQTSAVEDWGKPIKITTLLRDNGANRRPGIAQIAQLLSAGSKRARQGAPPASRYFPRLDLSHRLDGGDALLLAKTPRLVSRLLRDAEPLENEHSRHWVFVRYVLPVDEP